MSCYRTSTSQERERGEVGALVGIGLLVIAVLAMGFAWFGINFVHWVAGESRSLFFAGFILSVLAAVVFVTEERNDSSMVLMSLLGIIAFVGFVGYMASINYLRAQSYNSASMSTVQNDVPNYKDRVPYDVAVSTASRNLQNTTGSIGSPRFLADADSDGQWNALVTRKGFAVGYESIQVSNIPIYGVGQSKDVSFCDFPSNANLRWGGAMWWNSLSRALYWKVSPSVSADSDSIYSYCEGEDAVVVIPLYQTTGFFVTHKVPFGVATYKDGVINVTRDADDIAKIPGSTYPKIVAAEQRSALSSTGSFLDHVFDRSGYYASDDDGGSQSGYNNPSEIQLARADDGVDFVTPLTPPGSSRSIVGLSVIDAKMKTPGTLNPIVVHKYPNGNTRSANSAVSDNIKSQYSALSDWANGMDVYEIVPGADGEWVASIGKQQSVVYRATITQDGVITLHSATGVVGQSSGANGADSDSDSDSDDDRSGSVVGSVSTGVDTSTMSKDELVELIKQATEELASR